MSWARVSLVPQNPPPLPDFTRWPSFPFEGDMRVKNLAEPVDVEPPRSGEDAGDCVACNTPDDAYIWVNERWRVRGMDRPTGLPMVLILECRSHLDIGDLPNLLAAELGVMTVRLERAIRTLDGVARVHVNRWGDGSAHLHMWFLARPYGRLQLRGTFLSLWDDILPVIPEEEWLENLALVAEWLAGFGGRAIAEPAHIHWQSPSTFSNEPAIAPETTSSTDTRSASDATDSWSDQPASADMRRSTEATDSWSDHPASADMRPSTDATAYDSPRSANAGSPSDQPVSADAWPPANATASDSPRPAATWPASDAANSEPHPPQPDAIGDSNPTAANAETRDLSSYATRANASNPSPQSSAAPTNDAPWPADKPPTDHSRAASEASHPATVAPAAGSSPAPDAPRADSAPPEQRAASSATPAHAEDAQSTGASGTATAPPTASNPTPSATGHPEPTTPTPHPRSNPAPAIPTQYAPTNAEVAQHPNSRAAVPDGAPTPENPATTNAAQSH